MRKKNMVIELAFHLEDRCEMTIYHVMKSYDTDDSIFYQVLPYDLKGTIMCHFKYWGFSSLIPFLMNCRLTESSARKLQRKRERGG